MLPSHSSILFLSILTMSFIILSPTAQAFVPASATFKYVNQGDFDMYVGEYGSTLRYINGIDTPKWFGVMFYNNTPNTYTLAIGMGFPAKWVWAANRAKPVRDGATLTFGKDGNLVLADVDRQIVWQTNTANKGVVGIKLLESGNLVLYNAKGKFVWQSFDHPTDTLLPGQSLRAGVADKLVSRVSMKNSLEGPYSLILRSRRVSMYYKSKNTPKLLQYNTMLNTRESTLKELKFSVDSFDGFLYEFNLEYSSQDNATGGTLVVSNAKYNSTMSFLRLDFDGNLRIYSFFDKVPDGVWTVEYTKFSQDSLYGEGNICELPERCGNFGVCYKDQCVACPSPNGLLGWSNKCESPKLAGCSGGNKNVKYYKIDGVEHFTSKYTKGEGPMKATECETKCTKDCKCLGYFYRQETSRCWIAHDLKTLVQSGNSKHLGYIKYSN